MIRLSQAVALLHEAGCTDALASARALFRHFEGLSDKDLYGTDPIGCTPALTEALDRRARGTPTDYILGYTDFYHERYTVTPDVLIPRPETEELVERAVQLLPPGGRLLDVCTGSGCIALSTLLHTDSTRATLVDLSTAALSIAEKNADELGLSARVTLLCRDVRTERVDGPFDLITANPPYINDDVYPTLTREVHAEPRMALVGGKDGMDLYRAILKNYRASLCKRGSFLFEIGFDQGERIRHLAEAHGLRAEVYRDLSGNDRIAHLHP